jgi:hypothetical protein
MKGERKGGKKKDEQARVHKILLFFRSRVKGLDEVLLQYLFTPRAGRVPRLDTLLLRILALHVHLGLSRTSTQDAILLTQGHMELEKAM